MTRKKNARVSTGDSIHFPFPSKNFPSFGLDLGVREDLFGGVIVISENVIRLKAPASRVAL